MVESRKKRRNAENMERNKEKKNKWKIVCLVLFVFMIFVYYQVYILFNYTMGKNVTESQIVLYKWMVSKINSEEAVDMETSVDIAVLGNIKARGELLDSYSENGIVDYSSIFENISFQDYDYTIANLNTSIVADTKSEGNFYANSKLIKELKKINIDMFITATKELAEESDDTVKETISAIKAQDIKAVGSNVDNEDSYYILNKDNIKIAILAYVDKDYAENDSVNVYSKKQLKQDVQQVKKEEVDGIIVFIDTLRNNQTKVKEDKSKLLQEILDEGADIVISSDTVDQKLYQNIDKTKYIKYSLGDVIGLQETEKSDISKVLKISINKKVVDGKSSIDFETYEDKTLVALSNSDMTKYKVVDLYKEINEFDETYDRITVAEYNYLKKVKGNLE